LRRIALHHTKFAKATCGAIRIQLLNIGALVRISVRRIKFAMASGCPAAAIWGCAATRHNAAASARLARVIRVAATRHTCGTTPRLIGIPFSLLPAAREQTLTRPRLATPRSRTVTP
jgi:hypothetical protein